MPLYNVSVPILAGGLSRQPAQVRLPDQLKRSENVTHSVAKGTSNRMGMRHRFSVTGFDLATRLITHAINRDSTEQYQVVIGKASGSATTLVKVYTAAGSAGAVTVTTAAQSYLDSGGVNPSNLRLATIADGTFILNTGVIPKVGTTSGFTVERTFANYSNLEAYIGTTNAKYQTTSADDTYAAGYWTYDDTVSINPATNLPNSIPVLTSGPAFAKLQFGNIVPTANDNGSWTLPTGAYDNPNINGTHTFTFRRWRLRNSGGTIITPSLTYTGSTKELTGSGSFSEYQWQAGDKIKVTTLSPLVNTTWYTVASKLNNNTIVLGSDAPGTNGSGSATAEFGVSGNVMFNFAGKQFSTMEEIAGEMQQQLRVLHPHITMTWIELDANGLIRSGRFEMGCPFRGQDALVVAPVFVSGTDWTGLRSAMQSAGSTNTAGGANSVGASGTFTTFTLDPARRWTRSEQPNQTDGKIDTSTMPLLMKRTSVSPLEFTVDVAPWAPRYNGSTPNNPPSAILTAGRPITDLCVFRDRLAICAGETIILSVAGDYFNLWVEDAGNLVDSDPIEVRPNVAAVANIQRMIPLGRSLLVLAEGGRQFELSAVDALTPSTVAYTPSTSHLSLNVKPVVVGPTAYFAASTPVGTTLMEYYRSSDNSVPESAADVGAHVEGLLGVPLNVAAEPSTRSVLMVPQLAAGADLHLYRSFFLGQQKRQSAWSVVKTGASVKVHDVSSIDRDFWILAETNSALALWTLPPDDDSASYLLDSWATTGTWTFGSGNSTITNPTIDPNVNTVIDGAGNEYACTVSTGTITVTGVNLTTATTPIIVGRSYSGVIELSRPYPRDQSGSPIATGRARYQSVELGLGTVGPMTIEVISASGGIRTKTVSATSTNPRVVLWSAGDADTTTIRVTMSRPRRVTVTSLDAVLEQVNTA